MPASTITSETRPKSGRALPFLLTNPTPDQKKAKSRVSTNFITIIAHGLERFENANTSFHRLSQKILEPLNTGQRRLFKEPSVYSFDIVELIKDGTDGRFHKAYTRFRKHVKNALPDKSRKWSSPGSQSPKIIFLAHGIASWLVKRLLAEAGEKIKVTEDHFLTLDQVESIIFLQDFPHSQIFGVSYSNYMKQWVDTLSEFSYLDENWFRNQDDLEDERTVDRETNGGKRLLERLRWIDDRFGELSQKQHVSSRTWVLDPRDPVTVMRQTSNLPGLYSIKDEKHITWPRRHRNTTMTARRVTVDIEVGRIVAFVQIASPLNSKAPQSDQSPAPQRVVLVSKDTTELKSHQYFPERQEKPDNIRNRPQVTHKRSSSAPQGAVASLMVSERTATGASNSLQRPYSYPPSRSLGAAFSDEQKSPWPIMFERAQKYLAQCDLDNADVLCKWCVDTGGDDIFKGTDIPFQWRMQRAVIQILRGHYRDAYTQLRSIHAICRGLLEGPGAAAKAWKIPEEPDDPGYLPQVPWPTRGPSEIAWSGTNRSQDSEKAQGTRKNLFILILELIYNIALALTQLGKFEEAEKGVIRLQKHFQLQWDLSCMSVTEMTFEEIRQYKVLVDTNVLLALLKAYRGSFSEAMRLIAEVDYLEKSVQDAEEINYRSQSLRDMTYAKILLSCGMIQEALELVRESVPEMETRLGKFHLTTLETRCLQALLLSKASKAPEAEALCSESNDLIKRHLGENHPFVLDIIYVLVSVCETQARPLQALRISENLCTRAEETLGAMDQRTIRFRAQQAWIHVWIGNYEKGELLLEETYKDAIKLWGPTHPWTLEYIPKLAFTYYLRGKTQRSKGYFFDALRKQMVAFGLVEDEDAFLNKRWHDLVQEVLSAICAFNTIADDQPIVLKRMHSGSGHVYPVLDPSRKPIHPDILLTLELWAEAESHEATNNQDLLLETLRIVYETRKTSASFGKFHVLTLRAGLSLAKSMTENSGSDMELVEKLYSELCRNARDGLDSEHPLTLSARQGLQTVQLVRETSALSSPSSISKFFASIQKAIEFRLGNNHPDVLRSSLNTFTLLMVVDIERAEEISQAFLEHVRTRALWDQRAVESVRLQEQLAWAYFTQEKAEAALAILEYLTRQLAGFGPEPDGDSPLYKLGLRIKQAERVVGKELEGPSTGDLKEEGT